MSINDVGGGVVALGGGVDVGAADGIVVVGLVEVGTMMTDTTLLTPLTLVNSTDLLFGRY